MMIALVRGEKPAASSSRIERPVRRLQRNQLPRRAAKLRIGMVVLVERLEDDDLVALDW